MKTAICEYKKIICMTIFVPLLSLAQNDTCDFKNKTNFTYSDLIQLIKNPKCQIKSIKDVVAKLPTFMSKTTILVNRSQSLQGPHKTDFIYPRAILNSLNQYEYHKSGIALSFNGHPSQANYFGLEVMSVDITKPFQDMFEYFDIQFPAESELENTSYEEIQKKIQFSNKNPESCQKCHGNPARPIFEQYPNWIGSLGSRHLQKLTKDEELGLTLFLDKHKADENSRYYWLNLNNFTNASNINQYNSSPINFDEGEQNLKFNKTLFSYNAFRVAKIIQAQSWYPQFKYSIWGASADCRNLQNFFPKEIFKKLKLNVSKNIPLKSNIKDIFPYPKADDFGGGIGDPILFEDQELLQLWYDTALKQGKDRLMPNAVFVRLILEGLGLNINNLWMDLNQPSYRMNSGGGEAWQYAFANLEPEFELLNKIQSDGRKVVSCNQLSQLSLESLKNYLVPEVISISQNDFVNNYKYPEVFTNTCVKCHDSKSKVAPLIPFANENLFKEWITHESNKQKLLFKISPETKFGKMPPTRDLTDFERNEIYNFLNHK